MQRRRWAILALLVVTVGTLTGCGLFNPPPAASFTWTPSDPLARGDVQFRDASTDAGGLFGGGGVVSWRWDFGDNTNPSTTTNPTHQYAKSGIYPVKLTVTDGDGGTTTVQKTITITPSLDGVWTGFIVNPGGLTDSFEMHFHHSASGGISGTVVYAATVLRPSSISFNDVSKEVGFDVPSMGIRLEGTLDASETRITGFWYVLGAPAQGFTWDVHL